MADQHVGHALQEEATLYALGILEEQRARMLEEHLRTCDVCELEVRAFQQTAAHLPFALSTDKPRPALRDRLFTRVQSTKAQEAEAEDAEIWPAGLPAGFHFVAANGGTWEPTGVQGVRFKLLDQDQVSERRTLLVRMEATATYPPHRHAGAEQCLVLEGDLRFGELVFRAGDYICAPAESIHPKSHTQDGCLLLIVSSLHDEALA